MIEDTESRVVVPARQRKGTFANAFRMLPDSGDEFLLDFCVYTQQEGEATVVSRLRIHKTLLHHIRAHLLGASMKEIKVSPDEFPERGVVN